MQLVSSPNKWCSYSRYGRVRSELRFELDTETNLIIVIPQSLRLDRYLSGESGSNLGVSWAGWRHRQRKRGATNLCLCFRIICNYKYTLYTCKMHIYMVTICKYMPCICNSQDLSSLLKGLPDLDTFWESESSVGRSLASLLPALCDSMRSSSPGTRPPLPELPLTQQCVQSMPLITLN